MKQRTEQWEKAREAHFTASRAIDLISGEQSLRNYVIELLEEHYLGIKREFSSYWTERGIELEPEARNYFMFETGLEVDECGFITNPKIPQAGASPDGLIGKDALLEIKCPNEANFGKALLGEVPRRYFYQIQFQLMITERKLAYYAVYHPDFSQKITIQEVKPDDKAFLELKLGLKQARRLYNQLKQTIYEKR